MSLTLKIMVAMCVHGGAAVQGAIMSGQSDEVGGVVILDVAPLSLGIETVLPTTKATAQGALWWASWDMDIGPLFQTPEEAARQAVENDVHVVAASSLAAGHLTLVPELKKQLAEMGRPDITIIVGGVIPPEDVPILKDMGAAAVYPPGTVIADSAVELIRIIERENGN